MLRCGACLMVLMALVAALVVDGDTLHPAGNSMEEWHAIEVIDGDTLRLAAAGKEEIVNLFGVDAPELAQESGQEARDMLDQLTSEQILEIKVKGREYGELVAIVTAAGNDLAAAMCDAGLAWLTEEGDTKEEYGIKIVMARTGKRGIWSAEKSTHPADWRRKHPKPTPIPAKQDRTLTDLAAKVEIAGTDDGKAVIDNLPSMKAQNKEARLFVDRMMVLANAARFYELMETAYNQHCKGGKAGDATVWSEQHKKWVSKDEAATGLTCQELREAFIDGANEITREKKIAVAEAIRGSVPQSDISEIISALKLNSY